jgi:GDPmannose 4,6-dehydratase
LIFGDPSKDFCGLGWKPKRQLPELIKIMMANDITLAEREQHLKEGGFKVKNFYE